MRRLLRLGLLASGCAAYNGYEVGTDPATYQEAAAYCASVGGALAAIYSDADNEAARDACGYQACWIGLRESGGDHTTHALDQTWAWPDNSTTAAYHNWALSEPDNGAAYDRRRAAMNEGYIGGAPSGLWYAVGDDKTYVPLCSVDVPTAAPTISPAPTLTPAPTSLFQCDNEMCTTDSPFMDDDDGVRLDNAPDDCCSTWAGCLDGSTPVIKDGHECRVNSYGYKGIYGVLFTCCTGFQIPTDEEPRRAGLRGSITRITLVAAAAAAAAAAAGGGLGSSSFSRFVLVFARLLRLRLLSQPTRDTAQTAAGRPRRNPGRRRPERWNWSPRLVRWRCRQLQASSVPSETSFQNLSPPAVKRASSKFIPTFT